MMEWTDAVERFDTLSGRIAVNGNPDRWALDNLSGEAVARAVETARGDGRWKTPSRWREACSSLQEVTGPVEFKRRLPSVMALADGKTGGMIRPWHAMRLLGALRLEGVVLWPITFPSMPHVCPNVQRWRIKVGLTALEQRLLAQAPHKSFGGLGMVLSCSPINSGDDISDIAVKRAVDVASRSANWTNWVTVQRGLTFLQYLEHLPRSDGTVISVVLPIQQDLYHSRKIGRNASRYGSAATRPDASPWIEVFDRFSAEVQKKSSKKDDYALAQLLNFLSTFGSIPAPAELRRSTHVLGPRGFLKWLSGRNDPRSSGYIHILRSVHSMFRVVQGQLHEILIHTDDIPSQPSHPGKSNKAVLPRGLVEAGQGVCRELLTLAFSQFDELSDQPWAPAGRVPIRLRQGELYDGGSLPGTLLSAQKFSRLLVTLRGADGRLRRIINPVLPLALLWLFRMPARGLETTLMDSGEGDELVPVVREVSGEWGLPRVEIEMVPNDHPLATKQRQLGAIAMIPDPGVGPPVPGFYLNTRKRPALETKNWDGGGRYIPWSDPEMLLFFYQMVRWQRRLNPVDRFTARNELRAKKMRCSDGLQGKLTGFCYLFRGLDDRAVGKRLEPVSTQQMHTFFALVLDEVEARMASEGATLPGNTLADDSEPSGRSLAKAFSLHCLRVTGITALAEYGLPFWIISEVLAGHESWLMTHAYNRISPARVGDELAQAQKRMEDGTTDREALRASRMPKDEIQGSFASNGEVLVAVEGAQIVGFWLPMVDGICPNGATRCPRAVLAWQGDTGRWKEGPGTAASAGSS